MILKTGSMRLEFDEKRAAFVSLRGENTTGTARDTEYLLTPAEFPEYDISQARWLGNVFLTIEYGKERMEMDTGSSSDVRELRLEKQKISTLFGEDSKSPGGIRKIQLFSEYEWDQKGMRWSVRLKNPQKEPIIVKKLGIPLLMNQYFRGDNLFKYEKCVLRHTCITHHHSYLYWGASCKDGETLFLQALGDTPLVHFSCEADHPVFGRRGSMQEAFEGCFYVYPVHESTQMSHLDTEELQLQPGAEKCFTFFLGMAENYGQLEQMLIGNGGITVQAVPGMCVPVGQEVKMMIGGACDRVSVKEEQDQLLEISHIGGQKIASLSFGGYGVRQVWLEQKNTVMKLSFFAMEKPGDMLRSQASFIASKQFETDPEDPCFHGLLMWDMTVKHRVNSHCNPYGADWMAGGSDEIGLVSGLFLAGKNVYLPKEEEIRVLDAYVKDFLVDRLTQQPGWRVHRMVPWFQMFEPWSGYGADDVWRAFNYVHVINTVYHMYQIAEKYSFDFLEAPTYYLKLAYEYMRAMFSYWMFPHGVGASEYGNMGERNIALYLEKALRKEGLVQQADWVHGIVESKAAYFASQEYPFGSEMPYDSTAFEAVYSYGKAIGNRRVMEMTRDAVCANRGRQPIWYLYGTDLRQMGDSSWNVSYMTQLGAYPVYDWLFHQMSREEQKEDRNQTAYLALTWYASYLAGWSLYNSGGVWSEEKENEGAAGWIVDGDVGCFSGRTKEKGPYSKGLVAMSGESGLGFYGALQIAAGAVIDHPILGRIGLGCQLLHEGEEEIIVPQDGLGIRLFHLIDAWSVILERDSIDKVVYDKHTLRIFLKNVTGDRHCVKIDISFSGRIRSREVMVEAEITEIKEVLI